MNHRLPEAFTGKNNKEVPTVLDTSRCYTLWDSICTKSKNPYFKIYSDYKHLGKEDDTEVNGI